MSASTTKRGWVGGTAVMAVISFKGTPNLETTQYWPPAFPHPFTSCHPCLKHRISTRWGARSAGFRHPWSGVNRWISAGKSFVISRVGPALENMRTVPTVSARARFAVGRPEIHPIIQTLILKSHYSVEYSAESWLHQGQQVIAGLLPPCNTASGRRLGLGDCVIILSMIQLTFHMSNNVCNGLQDRYWGGKPVGYWGHESTGLLLLL